MDYERHRSVTLRKWPFLYVLRQNPHIRSISNLHYPPHFVRQNFITFFEKMSVSPRGKIVFKSGWKPEHLWPSQTSFKKKRVFAHIRHIKFFSILKHWWKNFMQILGGVVNEFLNKVSDIHIFAIFSFENIFLEQKTPFETKKSSLKIFLKVFWDFQENSWCKIFMFYASGEITKGNWVFMKNISGEITKEIFSVFFVPP